MNAVIAPGPAPSMAAIRLRERIEAFEDAVLRTRANHDREAIHDLRVASRRLAAFIRTWRDLLPEEDVRRIRRDLRRLRRRIGRARDLEVQLDLLRAWVNGHGTSDARTTPILQDLEAGLARRRRRAAIRVRPKRSRRMSALLAGVEQGMRKDLVSQLRAFERAHERERTRRHAVVEALPGSLAAEEDETLHALRIAIKKWRYTVESLSEGAASEIGVGLDQIRALQESLGAVQDHALLREALARHLGGPEARGADGAAAAAGDDMESERRALVERFRTLGTAFLRDLRETNGSC